MLTKVSYRMEPKTNKWKKPKRKKTDTLRSIGKQSVESVESVVKTKRKDLRAEKEG